jgi:prepilin-type N-terminal cleavage/methylation domain-containing protein/prepilin-type processing-associated H-X9-DG protein
MTSETRRPRADSPGGFTLVELLVVIAILTLLAAIMLPALQSVWSSVHRSRCSNNLSQLGRALHSYAINSDTYLPLCERYAFDVWNRGPGWVGLGHLMGAGVLSEQDGKLFDCPAYRSSDWNPTMPGYSAVYVGHGMYTYDWGDWHGWHKVGQGSRTIISYQYRMSGFDHPFSEGGYGRSMRTARDSQRAVVGDQLDWRFGPDFCHKTGLNVLFLDGHVAWFRDSPRYIEVTGRSAALWDRAGPEFEVFWKLFDSCPSGNAEVGELVSK